MGGGGHCVQTRDHGLLVQNKVHQVLKLAPFVCLFDYDSCIGIELSGSRSTALITSLFCTLKMADACLVCLY